MVQIYAISRIKHVLLGKKYAYRKRKRNKDIAASLSL